MSTKPTKNQAADRSGVDEDARAVYSEAVSADYAEPEEIRAGLGLPGERFDRAVERLRALGLLEPPSSSPAPSPVANMPSLYPSAERLHPVAFTTAVMRACEPLLRSMAEGQERASRLSALVTAFAPAHTANSTAGSGAVTERLVTLDAVHRTLSELSAQANWEILTSQPGGPRPEEQLKESLDRTEEALGRGVAMRTLYQHSAQFSQVTVAHVRHVSRLGAQVRTVNDAFMRLIVFDRHTAVMSLRTPPVGALVVRDPDVVEFAAQAYERAWAAGRPFPVQYERKQVIEASEDVKQSIMRLLVEGLEVTVIAKRLGVSHRTCQRHISEIMQRIGARNRLQAGYLIGHLGLLADFEPTVFTDRPSAPGTAR
jgi:DNA-directed RNA polymerase specialized sigma24 family protein